MDEDEDEDGSGRQHDAVRADAVRADAVRADAGRADAVRADADPANAATMTATAPVARPGGRLPGWVPYTTLRILFFLVPLVIVYGFGRNLVLSGVVATLVGLCLSIIFLNRQRRALAVDIDALSRGGRRPQAPPTDESMEDAALGVGDRTPTDDAAQSANTNANPTP